MSHIQIHRIYQDDCTIGILNLGDFRCFTLELPWKDNANDISCIPPGVYTCKKIESPSLGHCIEIEDVQGRTYVRIHAGNYTSQIQGCILVGTSLLDMNGDGVIDVSNSKPTLKSLMGMLPEDGIMLTIS